jgi:serine protease
MLLVRLPKFVTLIILLALLAMQSGQVVPVNAAAGRQIGKAVTDPGVYNQPTDQVIVKYKDTVGNLQALPDSASQVARLSQAAGVALTYLRPMSGGAHVMRMTGKKPVAEVQVIAKRLSQLPEVEYAEPDRILYHTMVPNDPQYPSQWHYSAPVAGSYGINLPAAWDITTGSTSVVVADIDSGITNHPEFSGRTMPGYDMIVDTSVSNDGDGRDADPSDTGDWTAANQCFAGSPAGNSSWHGTQTAGTIGAASNNSAGVAGINWVSKILPVRVLGKCGGFTSDILDGMRWAAGLAVIGVPANPNPAKVENLSLSGIGACLAAEQSAINAIIAVGTTVVVSAGNSAQDASGFSPGNCDGVITVAATDRNGDMANYSNFGSTVKIAAPGGAQAVPGDSNGVLTTMNSGTTIPGTPSYAFMQGTSLAAPQVSGVVSLLYSINPSLTPAQALSIIQSTATHFPPGSTCDSSLCGSGILNAGDALAAAMKVIPPQNHQYLPVISRPSGP